MSEKTELIVRPEQTVIRHRAAEASFQEVEQMATAMAKSGLFAVKSKEEAIGLMMLCQAEGLHPVDAFRRYHIIKGRPSMRADAMQAEFQARGGRVQWIESNDKVCVAEFSHPSGGSLQVEWDIDRAKRAGLLGNAQWQNYPRAMLRARTISEGVRAILPGVVVGIYTPEEVEDFEEPEPPRRREPEGRRETQPAERRAAEPPRKSPAEVVKDALTDYADRGWVVDRKLDRGRLEALKGYLGVTGDVDEHNVGVIVEHLALGWEEIDLRIKAESQRQAEEAQRAAQRAAKAAPAADPQPAREPQREPAKAISRKAEPAEDAVDAPFDFGDLG